MFLTVEKNIVVEGAISVKKDYMARLERWARWMLPRQEAEDVIADYRDIAADPEMLRGLDKPRNVLRPLTQKKPYYTWLAVFAVLAACILIPGASPHGPFWRLWDVCFGGPYGGGWTAYSFSHWGPILAGIGLIASLVWFRHQGRKEGRLPKAAKVWLAVLAAWLAAVFGVSWLALRAPQGFMAMWGEVPWTYFGVPIMGGMTRPLSTLILTGVLQYGGTAAAILGVYALVQARAGDRRWAAVYCLAMAVMLVSMEFLAVFTAMDPTAATIAASWYLPVLGQCAAYSAIGFIGAGAALC